MAEGMRLLLRKEPYTLYDPAGPGVYIIAVSIGIMIIGVLHPIVNYRKVSAMEKVPVDKKMRKRMMSTVAICAIYIFIINIVGYLLATIIFFFLDFRAEGVKPWPLVVVLSLVLSAFFYFTFVQYCSIVFPRGIFFR